MSPELSARLAALPTADDPIMRDAGFTFEELVPAIRNLLTSDQVRFEAGDLAHGVFYVTAAFQDRLMREMDAQGVLAPLEVWIHQLVCAFALPCLAYLFGLSNIRLSLIPPLPLPLSPLHQQAEAERVRMTVTTLPTLVLPTLVLPTMEELVGLSELPTTEVPTTAVPELLTTEVLTPEAPVGQPVTPGAPIAQRLAAGLQPATSLAGLLAGGFRFAAGGTAAESLSGWGFMVSGGTPRSEAQPRQQAQQAQQEAQQANAQQANAQHTVVQEADTTLLLSLFSNINTLTRTSLVEEDQARLEHLLAGLANASIYVQRQLTQAIVGATLACFDTCCCCCRLASLSPCFAVPLLRPSSISRQPVPNFPLTYGCIRRP